MGMSLTAKLFYGVSFGSEDEWYEKFDDESDFLADDHEEWIAENFCNIQRETSEYEGNEKLHEEYWDKKWAANKQFPIDIGRAHSHDYTVALYVFIKGTEVEAYFESVLIDPAKLVEPSEEMKNLLLEVVKKTGYNGEIKMGWHMVPQYF